VNLTESVGFLNSSFGERKSEHAISQLDTYGSFPMKRIILLLDGTWNDSDFGDSDTNIVRIGDIIARSLDPDQASDPNADEAPAALVRARGFKG